MIRCITIFLTIALVGSEVQSQTLENFKLQFDKPFYAAGETVWFAFFQMDSGTYENVQEVLHFELLSPRNIRIVQGKIPVRERLGSGYFTLPENLEEGYYRFRAFTLRGLQHDGDYLSADIPVYSGWKENLTVYKYDELPGDKNQIEEEIQIDKKKRAFSRRDTVELLEMIPEQGYPGQYLFWVRPKEFEKLAQISVTRKKIPNAMVLNTDPLIEDSLYFEAVLSEQATGKGVTSSVISIYSGRDQHFYRASIKEGQLTLKIPYFNGRTNLQIFNLDPYQFAVNDLKVRQWKINEAYFNPSNPPLTKEIAEYLIKTKRLRKVDDLFSLTSIQEANVFIDSVKAVPDVQYKMDDYRFIKDLEDFIFEAIPGARILTREDGTKTARLYNPSRRDNFVDRPWYIVDGYLTNREQEVLKIPFEDIDEIKLYVRTSTIRVYFEYFLWRNGVMEVKTKDIKYLRSLKTDPNYVEFEGLIPDMDFVQALSRSKDPNTPDFRTTMHWETGNWENANRKISFQLSDDTGEFIYHFIAILDNGEIVRKQGEFVVK